MNPGSVTVVIIALLVGVTGLFIIRWKTPYRLKVKMFLGEWKNLQDLCKDKTTWIKAIISADKLLDKALKKRKYKGKSMGERMVNAQRIFSDNDGIWSAHNLCKKIIVQPDANLRESVIKKTLIAYRQALKDIGALPNVQPKK